MIKRFKFPGTDVTFILEQDAEFKVKLKFDVADSSFLWPSIDNDLGTIAALGFPTGPETIEGGEVEVVE